MVPSLLLNFICLFSLIGVQPIYSAFCSPTHRVSVKKTRTNYESCRQSSTPSDQCGQIVYYTTQDFKYTRRCCNGWRGPTCDIPVCSSPRCKTNEMCYDKNRCFCRSSSWGYCTVAKCSSRYDVSDNDCFPGTCKTGNYRNCQCASGFTGTNCLTMKDSPTFIKCQISLLATSNGKERVVFTKPCNSEEQLYSNAQHISHVAMDWDTKYTTPEDVPSKPSYIRSYRFGIISAGVQGTLNNGNGVSIDSISIPCTSRVNQESPVEALSCSNHTYLGATNIGHGYRVEATAKASSGGYKERSGSWPSRRMFAGKTASQSASVTFDLRAPTHCADPGRCLDGGGLAVDVGREIDKSVSSTRKLRWFGWNDADSGLNTFTYEVYPLAPDSNGLLTEKSKPVAKDARTAFDTSYPTYTLPGPGMYSVILEVTDSVGNSAYARGLLLWDSQSSVTMTDQPMLVTGATPSGGGVVVVWMTSPVNLLRPLVIHWRGHFENAFHHNNKLLNAAKPWLKGLDDREGDLTVDAIPNVLGIMKFTFGRSDVSRTTPVTWVDVRLNEHYELRATIADGGSIRVYVEAYDIMGNSATDSLVVGVDSTSPQVQSHTFEKNIGSGESKLPHSSRFTLFVHDKESGISTIHYHVTDVKDDSDIWTGIVSGQLETEDKHKCRDDGPCVCTPHNGCYRRNQVLYIDHCWLVHSVGHAIAVTATVYNHAGLSTTTTVKLGLLKGLYGINKCSGYTSASKLGAGAIVGIVIGTLFVLLVWTAACLAVVFVWTRRRRNEPYWPHNFSDFRHTLRQSVQFGHNATPNPNEFQLNSNRQQQAPPTDAADGEDVDMATDDVADWKMPAEKVVLGKRLSNATGRFADIYEATVKLNSVRQKVVAKKVKHGGNADSILLMTAKMNFWATACPKHENILHFVGAVPSGPILLFELCDLGRLNDWLAAQTQLTEELQDNMITFSLQIARGMKHLHAHKIVHRRLGARNVLLKSDDVGSIVAKVAGFGPTKDEVQGGENDSAEGKIPVKWMAPEQLNLEPGAKRKHDAKTDIWSFGVTLWEIFSKGETPYSDCVSGEVTAMLSTGYRMPRPTHCPDMMFDRVVTPCWAGSAISRPSFAGVVTTIETVFLTGGGGDEYYYERTEDLPEHGYDNNTYEPTS